MNGCKLFLEKWTSSLFVSLPPFPIPLSFSLYVCTYGHSVKTISSTTAYFIMGFWYLSYEHGFIAHYNEPHKYTFRYIMYFDEIQLFLFFLPLPPFLLTFRLSPSLLLSYKMYTWFCISIYNPEFTNRRKHYFLGLLILLSIVISSPVHFPENVMILFFFIR